MKKKTNLRKKIVGISLGQAISNYNNQMITLYEAPIPLNEASFRQPDFLKLPKLITLPV
jgi:hypothetical protein